MLVDISDIKKDLNEEEKEIFDAVLYERERVWNNSILNV